MVHGVEFGLLAALDPIPCTFSPAQQVRDFVQGTLIVRRDPVE